MIKSEMNFDQFAGLSIDVAHVGAGPVNFAAFSRFMADPARQVVLEHVFGVAFVELSSDRSTLNFVFPMGIVPRAVHFSTYSS